MRSSTRTRTHLPNHSPTHTTVNINQTHTSLDTYTPLKDNQTVRSTKAFHNVEKEEEQQHTFRLGDIRLGLSPSPPSSVSGTSVSGASVSGPSVSGRPSSRRRRPKRMAVTDIPEMERHEDGGSIRLSFPSHGHPPVPFVSAIRLLQFDSSKYTLASFRVEFIWLQIKTRD